MLMLLIMLIPALVVRYVIVREPIPKIESWIICGVYLFILAAVNVLLDGLIVSWTISIALVWSFSILRAKGRRKEAEIGSDSPV